jgi:hypothetical protein
MHAKYTCHLCQEICDCELCNVQRAAPELLTAARLVLQQFIDANPPCLIPAIDRLATAIAHAAGRR